jgi:hypothetical protein
MVAAICPVREWLERRDANNYRHHRYADSKVSPGRPEQALVRCAAWLRNTAVIKRNLGSRARPSRDLHLVGTCCGHITAAWDGLSAPPTDAAWSETSALLMAEADEGWPLGRVPMT